MIGQGARGFIKHDTRAPHGGLLLPPRLPARQGAVGVPALKTSH